MQNLTNFINDPISIISNHVISGKLDWASLIDIIKKSLVVVGIKFLFDNFQKYFSENYKKINIIKFITHVLTIFKMKKLTLIKNSELTDIEKNVKLNYNDICKLIGTDIMKNEGYTLKFLYNSIVLIYSGDGVLDFYTLNNIFQKKLTNDYKLKPIVEFSSIETEYKVLYCDSKRETDLSGGKNDKKLEYKWITPNWIHLYLNNDKNAHIINMVSEFVINTYDTHDFGTTGFIINSPPGYGKTTILDELYYQKNINLILKINFMNFINYPDTFESLIRNFVCTYPCKSSTDFWLITFDEIDKWLPLWCDNRTKIWMFDNKISSSCINEIKEYKKDIYFEFYNTLQRLLDGEIIIKISRLILFLFTNNSESMWLYKNNHHEALLTRLIVLELEPCNKYHITTHLKSTFSTIKKCREMRGLVYEYDESIFDTIRNDIQIPFRDYKNIIKKNNYNVHKIITEINSYQLKIPYMSKQNLISSVHDFNQEKKHLSPNKQSKNTGQHSHESLHYIKSPETLGPKVQNAVLVSDPGFDENILLQIEKLANDKYLTYGKELLDLLGYFNNYCNSIEINLKDLKTYSYDKYEDFKEKITSLRSNVELDMDLNKFLKSYDENCYSYFICYDPNENIKIIYIVMDSKILFKLNFDNNIVQYYIFYEYDTVINYIHYKENKPVFRCYYKDNRLNSFISYISNVIISITIVSGCSYIDNIKSSYGIKGFHLNKNNSIKYLTQGSKCINYDEYGIQINAE